MAGGAGPDSKTSELESTPAAKHPQEERAPRSAAGGEVTALLTSGAREPDAYADVVRRNPAARHEIIELLQQTIGHGMVLQIVERLATPQATGAEAELAAGGGELPTGDVRVTAPHGLRIRSAPDARGDNVLGMLQHDASVNASERHGEWLGIQHQGAPAFINGRFVESAKAPAPQAIGGGTAPQSILPPVAHAEAAPAPTPLTPVAVPDVRVVSPTAPHEDKQPDKPVVHAVASGVAPPEGSNTPNTADHTPAATPYTGTMDRRGGKKLDDTAYMAQYQHLAGGGSLADDPTRPEEATILNKIRVDDRKIDPISLRTLQEKLQIKDATGAMNTETLRKLMLDHKDFSFEGLMSGRLLGSELAITAVGGNGYGTHGDGRALREPGAIRAGEHKADAMARVAGFQSYAEMNGSFTDLELFGQPLGQGLPYLAERLKLADAYLRQRIPEAANVTDRKKLKAMAQQKLQWDGTGNGAYSDNVADIAKPSGGKYGAHFHAAGLAIDINPTQNPFVFLSGAMSNEHGESIDGYLADNLRYAAQIYGGEEITPKIMKQWSDSLSSEELTAKIDMVSTSLNKYLTLCETASDEDLKAKFTNAGYARTELTQLVHIARRFARDGRRLWQDNMSREPATKLTTHSMELVVALRDVAGLSWGGTEMSEGANGDFMHFDVRHSTVGKKLFEFAMANQGEEPAMPGAQHQDAAHGATRPPENH